MAGGAGIDLRLTDDTRAVELRVAGPAGEALRRSFAAGSTPSFAVEREDGSRHADGAYTWELRSIASPLRTRGEAEAGGEGIAEAGWVASGAFSIRNGAVVAADERERNDARAARPTAASAPVLAPMDQVIPDDLIVQGSACVGLDCVNGESFGFDTIRLKENNLRIKFEDTSVGAFPTPDWQLTANDSVSGGQAEDLDPGHHRQQSSLHRRGQRHDHSVYVDSTGRVGFRTATPVLDLHVNTSNTPGHRLEQNSSGGFTAQTWDIAGNEANFFVRDVTGGSRLPFRIRPGAPTSSIDISADGKVGIGTASPGQKLDVAEGDVKVQQDQRRHDLVFHRQHRRRQHLVLDPARELRQRRVHLHRVWGEHSVSHLPGGGGQYPRCHHHRGQRRRCAVGRRYADERSGLRFRAWIPAHPARRPGAFFR